MSGVHNTVAQVLFECAISSPLADTLVAASFLLRSLNENAQSSFYAVRDIDELTTEALLWQPLSSEKERAPAPKALDVSRLDPKSSDFVKAYSAARRTRFAFPEAELAWLDYAQLCVAYGTKRAIRKALLAGLYFSDLVESPAESLMIARCVELGFEVPELQVNILDPADGQFLGRVDGLWPSKALRKGLFETDSKYGRLLYTRQNGDNESIIVEFDGQLKYQEDFVDVLEKERLRQNSIGNLGFRFVRINWDDLMQPDQLRSILTAAKVPRANKS